MNVNKKTFSPEVVASLAQGKICLSDPGKIDDVGRGDLVEWKCRNDTGQALTLKIGNFRPGDQFKDQDECRDLRPDPFEPGRRDVELPVGGKGVISCRILQEAHYPRTYKYDFLDGYGKVLLDPEIEIERP